MRYCDVSGCGERHYAFGLCNKHYQRERKGVPVARDGAARLLPEIQRLVARRQVTEYGCWEWTGATNGVGYGQTTIRYRTHYTHRLSYQLAAGSIPAGLVIDHLCRNTLCFNPGHLEPVTTAENLRRSPKVGMKTHCKWGHEFTPENTYVSPAGARRCLECSRRRQRERRAAIREGV